MAFIFINDLKIDREDITKRLQHGLTEDNLVEIITLTNEDETLYKKWVKLADKIRPLHASRIEMAACYDDYKNIIILGFSKEKRKAYNEKLKIKKANVKEDKKMELLRKLKKSAQSSLSRIWHRLHDLCFPPLKLTKTKEEEEEDKQAEEKEASAPNSKLDEGEEEGDEDEGHSVVSRAQSENDMDVEEDFEDMHPPAAGGGGAAGNLDEGEFIFCFFPLSIFTDPLFPPTPLQTSTTNSSSLHLRPTRRLTPSSVVGRLLCSPLRSVKGRSRPTRRGSDPSVRRLTDCTLVLLVGVSPQPPCLTTPLLYLTALHRSLMRTGKSFTGTLRIRKKSGLHKSFLLSIILCPIFRHFIKYVGTIPILWPW